MKLKITELEVKTASNGNEYISILLMNEDDPFDSPTREAVFDTNLVGFYKNALNTAGGDLTKMPASIMDFNFSENYTHVFEKPMFRRWGTDGDHTGKGGALVHHNADDLILDSSGNPKLYYQCSFLVKHSFDKEKKEMGFPANECLGWARGWSPADRLNQLIGRVYIMPSEATQAPASTSTPTAPQAPVAPQAPQAPTQAQPAPQGAPAQGTQIPQ